MQMNTSPSSTKLLSKKGRFAPRRLRQNEGCCQQVSADLKDFVYNTFLEKLSSSSNGFSEEYDKYIADRNRTINVEYCQSIIIWHIATDLCFDTDSGVNEPKNDLLRKVSKDVSDYVMYIPVMCPLLLSTGDAKFCFKIIGAMITELFRKKKFAGLPKTDVCTMLISDYDVFFWPKHEALGVRINNDSLEDCLLHFAVLTEKKLSKMEREWEILSKYWVENLAYVATCNSLSRKSSCSTTQKRWGVSYTRLAFDRAFEPQRKFSKVTNKTTLGRSHMAG